NASWTNSSAGTFDMEHPEHTPRMDRRDAIKWMLTAAASMALPDGAFAEQSGTGALPSAPVTATGYGPDPSMVKIYKPGDVWPLTLDDTQRKAARALCDVIIPADDTSPSASAVGVPDFIDEWVSAPYPDQAADRGLILEGLAWIDAEARRRHGKVFAKLSPAQQSGICDDICDPATV